MINKLWIEIYRLIEYWSAHDKGLHDMTDTQKMDVRIIGDNGKFLDMELDIKDFSCREGVFTLTSHPGLEVINSIKSELCGQDCECKKHEYYQIRDIYNDGDFVLEIYVERIKS